MTPWESVDIVQEKPISRVFLSFAGTVDNSPTVPYSLETQVPGAGKRTRIQCSERTRRSCGLEIVFVYYAGRSVAAKWPGRPDIGKEARLVVR